MSTTDEPTPTAASEDTETTAPRRPVDRLALVAGLLFLIMAAVFAFADLDDVGDQVRYVWPTTLLALGAGMLVGNRR